MRPVRPSPRPPLRSRRWRKLKLITQASTHLPNISHVRSDSLMKLTGQKMNYSERTYSRKRPFLFCFFLAESRNAFLNGNTWMILSEKRNQKWVFLSFSTPPRQRHATAQSYPLHFWGHKQRHTDTETKWEREREKRMYFWFVLWRPFERMMTETFQFPVYFFIVLSLSLFLFPSLSFLHASHHVSLIILYFLFYFTHSVYFNINFKQYSTGKLSLLLFLNTFLCVSFKNYYFFFLSLNFKMSFKGN